MGEPVVDATTLVALRTALDGSGPDTIVVPPVHGEVGGRCCPPMGTADRAR